MVTKIADQIILLLLLSGCFKPQSGCTNIALFDYGETYHTMKVYWWEAEYYDTNILNFNGIVIAKRYIGEGSYKDVQLCKDPVMLTGWYSVDIPDGQGSWILTGRGWGKQVDVRPNSIKPFNLERMTKEN